VAWLNGSNFAPHGIFEISNGRIEKKSEVTVSCNGNFNYAWADVQATVFHEFDVKKFSMNNYNLMISLEVKNSDVGKNGTFGRWALLPASMF
jgi:hypothetical protein